MGVRQATSFTDYDTLFLLDEGSEAYDYADVKFNIHSRGIYNASEGILKACVASLIIGPVGGGLYLGWKESFSAGWHIGITTGEAIVWDWQAGVSYPNLEDLIDAVERGDYENPNDWYNFYIEGEQRECHYLTLGFVDRVLDSDSTRIAEIEVNGQTRAVHAYYSYGYVPTANWYYYDEGINKNVYCFLWDINSSHEFIIKYGCKFKPVELLRIIKDGQQLRTTSENTYLWQYGMQEIIAERRLAAAEVYPPQNGNYVFGISARGNSNSSGLTPFELNYNGQPIFEIAYPELLEGWAAETTWQSTPSEVGIVYFNYITPLENVRFNLGFGVNLSNVVVPDQFEVSDFTQDFIINYAFSYICNGRKVGSFRTFEISNVESERTDYEQHAVITARIGGLENNYFMEATIKNNGSFNLEIKYWDLIFKNDESNLKGYKSNPDNPLLFDFIPFKLDDDYNLNQVNYTLTDEASATFSSPAAFYFDAGCLESSILYFSWQATETQSNIEYSPPENYQGEIELFKGYGGCWLKQHRTFDFVLCKLNLERLADFTSISNIADIEGNRCFIEIGANGFPAYLWFGSSGYKESPSTTDYHIRIAKRLDAKNPDGSGESFSPLPSFDTSYNIEWQTIDCSIGSEDGYVKIYNFTNSGENSPALVYCYNSSGNILFPPYRFIYLKIKLKGGKHIPFIRLGRQSSGSYVWHKILRGFLVGDWEEQEIEGIKYYTGLIAFDITAPDELPTSENYLVGDNFGSLIEITKKKGFSANGTGEPTENIFIPSKNELEEGWSYGAFYLHYPSDFYGAIAVAFDWLDINEVSEIALKDFYCQIKFGLEAIPLAGLERKADIEGYSEEYSNGGSVKYVYYFNRAFLIFVDKRLVGEAISRDSYLIISIYGGEETIYYYETNYAATNIDYEPNEGKNGLYPNYIDLEGGQYFETNLYYSSIVNDFNSLLNNKYNSRVYLGDEIINNSRTPRIYHPDGGATNIIVTPFQKLAACPLLPAWLITDTEIIESDNDFLIRLKTRLFADLTKIKLRGSGEDLYNISQSILPFYINGQFLGGSKILNRLPKANEQIIFKIVYQLDWAGYQLVEITGEDSNFESNRLDSKAYFEFKDENNNTYYYKFDNENNNPLTIMARLNSAHSVHFSIYSPSPSIIKLLRMRQGKARRALPEGLNYEDFVNI